MSEYKQIRQFGHKIYESPDGGRTVYERQIGSLDRVLVGENLPLRHDVMEQLKYDIRYSDYLDIMRAAETNPTLRESLDNLLITYNLIKHHE